MDMSKSNDNMTGLAILGMVFGIGTDLRPIREDENVSESRIADLARGLNSQGMNVNLYKSDRWCSFHGGNDPIMITGASKGNDPAASCVIAVTNSPRSKTLSVQAIPTDVGDAKDKSAVKRCVELANKINSSLSHGCVFVDEETGAVIWRCACFYNATFDPNVAVMMMTSAIAVISSFGGSFASVLSGRKNTGSAFRDGSMKMMNAIQNHVSAPTEASPEQETAIEETPIQEEEQAPVAAE